MKSTRRTVLASISSTFLFLIPKVVAAEAVLRTRSSHDSVAGKVMLSKYGEAVRAMNSSAISQSSPRSWIFQWYTHAVPTSKQAELRRVFGNQDSQLKQLATSVWGTCQAHFPGADPDMFLPWHRMYLLAFEQVVRAVLADDDFDLPYWDYTRSGNRSLPLQFRSPAASPVGALFRQNRNAGAVRINAGDPMDKGSFGDPFGRGVLEISDYGGETGFCQSLDSSVHGNVHVGIGDRSNMGAVATAAGDPIFWLHHCNIDRLWAAWNKNGGKNTFGSAKFAFAGPEPAGKALEWEAASVGETQVLGYQYDDLPTVPPKPVSGSTSGAPPRTIAASTAGVEIGSQGVRIPLRTPSADGVISGSVASATATGRIFLVLSGLSSAIEPGTLYEAFVDLPPNASETEKRARYLGTFSFFGQSGEHHHHGFSRGPSFEVTDRLKSLRDRNLLGAEMAISILPVTAAQAGAKPMVGAVELQRR